MIDQKPWEMYGAAQDEQGAVDAADQEKPWERYQRIERETASNIGAPDFWSSKAGRFLQGAAEPIIGTGQLAAHLTGYGTEYMDTLAQQAQESYQSSRQRAGLSKDDWDWWAGLGNVASPINYIPGGAVARVAGPARSVLGMAARGALAGGAYGAMTPVTGEAQKTYAEEKAAQIGGGAIAGGVAGPAVEKAARIVSPKLSEGVKTLIGEGVELTPGQIAGGVTKRLEDVAASTPLVGGWVRSARESATESFNRAAINKTLGFVDDKLPKNVSVGHEAIAYTEDRLSQAYEKLHNGMSGSVDRQLYDDVNDIITQAATHFPDQQLSQLERIVGTQIIKRARQAQNGMLPGKTIHGVSSELRRKASGYAVDPSLDNRELGAALSDVDDALTAMLERQNPGKAAELKRLNEGWAHFVRVRKAASSTAAQEGVFTPTQLAQAARASDRSAGKRRSARGEAFYQKLAEAGKGVMPSKVPDSGTPERLLTHGALMGGAAYFEPTSLTGLAAIPLLYSNTGQRALRAALTKRPAGAEQVADILRRYGQTSVPRVAAQPFVSQQQ